MMHDSPMDVLLSVLLAWPRVKRMCLLATTRAGPRTALAISIELGLSKDVVAMTLRRLERDGFVVRDGMQHVLRCRPAVRWKPVPGVEEALELPQMRPRNAVFWWESNECWGWVHHPLQWQTILVRHAPCPSLASVARRAEWDHPTSLVPGVRTDVSFGLRGEHTGEPLVDWATREGPEWLK